MNRTDTSHPHVAFPADQWIAYGLEIRLEAGLDAAAELVMEIEAAILLHSDGRGSPAAPAAVQVGKARAIRVFADRAEQLGERLLDVCDAHSQTAIDYYAALFDQHGDYRPEIERLFPDVVGSDFLVLDLIELEPDHRGRQVGLRTARRLMDLFGGGCGIVACNPSPLQHSHSWTEDRELRARLALDRFTSTEAVARRKLRSYWGRLGFRRIGRSPYFAHCPLYRAPCLTRAGGLDVL